MKSSNIFLLACSADLSDFLNCPLHSSSVLKMAVCLATKNHGVLQKKTKTTSAYGNTKSKQFQNVPMKRSYVPKAGTIKPQVVTQKRKSMTQSSLPTSTLIIGCFYKYSDVAALWLHDYPTDEALYVLMLHHRVRRPSVTWNFFEKNPSLLAQSSWRRKCFARNPRRAKHGKPHQLETQTSH